MVDINLSFVREQISHIIQSVFSLKTGSPITKLNNSVSDLYFSSVVISLTFLSRRGLDLF